MQNKLLVEYAVLDKHFKELEKERDILRDAIVESLKKDNLDKVESSYGDFTIAKKTSWSYTAKVKAMEDKVKIAKDKEQKKGLAKASVTEYLLFKENK